MKNVMNDFIEIEKLFFDANFSYKQDELTPSIIDLLLRDKMSDNIPNKYMGIYYVLKGIGGCKDDNDKIEEYEMLLNKALDFFKKAIIEGDVESCRYSGDVYKLLLNCKYYTIYGNEYLEIDEEDEEDEDEDEEEKENEDENENNMGWQFWSKSAKDMSIYTPDVLVKFDKELKRLYDKMLYFRHLGVEKGDKLSMRIIGDHYDDMNSMYKFKKGTYLKSLSIKTKTYYEMGMKHSCSGCYHNMGHYYSDRGIDARNEYLIKGTDVKTDFFEVGKLNCYGDLCEFYIIKALEGGDRDGDGFVFASRMTRVRRQKNRTENYKKAFHYFNEAIMYCMKTSKYMFSILTEKMFNDNDYEDDDGHINSISSLCICGNELARVLNTVIEKAIRRATRHPALRSGSDILVPTDRRELRSQLIKICIKLKNYDMVGKYLSETIKPKLNNINGTKEQLKRLQNQEKDTQEKIKELKAKYKNENSQIKEEYETVYPYLKHMNLTAEEKEEISKYCLSMRENQLKLFKKELPWDVVKSLKKY